MIELYPPLHVIIEIACLFIELKGGNHEIQVRNKMDLLCSPPRQPRSEGEGSGQRSFETGGRFLHRHPLFALFDFLKLSFDFYVVVVVEKEQSRKNLKCLTPTIQFQCDTCVKNFKALNFAPFIFPK